MNKTRCVGIACLTGALLLTCCVNAFAQGRGGGARLAPKKAEAAWATQADAVAKDLALDESQKSKLRKNYVDARKRHRAALSETRSGEQEDRRARFEAMQKVSKKERAKLEEALTGNLKKAQVEKAMPVLGSFNTQWDRYVSVLTEMGVDQKKSQSAMKELNAWVAKHNKAQEEARANQDWQSMRSIRTELKTTLDTALAEVFSEEELKQWNEKTAGRSGRGGRARGGEAGAGKAERQGKPSRAE